MKRIFTAILAAAILASLFLMPVSAACQVSASASSSAPYVGDSVTFTFRFTGSAAIGGADTLFVFDTSKLQYKSYTSSLGSANINVTGGGSIKISDYSASGSSSTYTVTLTFTAKAVGAAAVKLTSSDIFANDDGATSLGTPTAEASVTIKAKPNPSLSSNCNLSALKVPDGCKLSPAFSSNVTQYTCTVPYSVTSFPIEPTRSDSKAKIEFIGKVSLDVGKNTRSVRVTAEDGTTKTYTITITRQENTAVDPPVTEPPTPTATVPPQETISVTVGGKTFTLEPELTKEPPAGFIKEEYSYQGQTIETAVLSDVRLVLLADEVDVVFYIFNESADTFSLFQTLTSGAQTTYTIFAAGTQAVPGSWQAAELTLNDERFSAWQSDVLGDGYYILSAMNNTTGEKYLCVYCREDGTVQKLSPVLLAEDLPQNTQAPPVVLKKTFDLRRAALAGAVLLLAVVVTAIVILLVKRKKMQPQAASRDWGIDSPWNEQPAQEDASGAFFEVSQAGPAFEAEPQKEKTSNGRVAPEEKDSDFS